MDRMFRIVTFWIACCALALPAAHAAEAVAPANELDAERAEAKRLRAAVEQVKRETDGKILSVRSVKTGKVKFYRVKVLSRAGRVHVVQIRAAGGVSDAKAPRPNSETVTKDR
jgi:hypothetical protein